METLNRTRILKRMSRTADKSLLVTLFLSALIACAAGEAYCRDVKFEISLDKDRIALGETAQLGLSFYGTQSMPAPDIGNVPGLEIRYLGPSTMMTVINGQMSSSITHMYAILPLKTGKFQLGPFSFKFKNDTYGSGNVTLDVVEERAPPQARPESDIVKKMDLEDRLFLAIEVDKATAYVNELVPVTVKLYVNRLNVSDIQLPTFTQEGFSKVDFKEPRQYRQQLNGVSYEVLEFKTSIFGTKPGDYKLGPAKIKCNLVVRKAGPHRSFGADDFYGDDSFFQDFFTRNERYPIELKSSEAQLIVSPLPVEGRPKDFSGAVGDYQFVFQASPTKLKTGDPITIKMTINGRGNFNTVLSPVLESTDGFKAYEPQAKTEESRKTFTQVLIPETEQVTKIPKATFSYFDPERRIYRTISQGLTPIQVEKPKVEAPSQVVGPIPADSEKLDRGPDEALVRDISYIKEAPGRWLVKGRRIYRSWPFWSAFPVTGALLLGLFALRRRREMLTADTAYSRRLAAMNFASKKTKELKRQIKSAEPKAFYEAFSHIIHGYLANKLDISSAGLTTDMIERKLAEKGASDDTIRRVARLMAVCDEVRFSSMPADTFKMQTDFRELEVVLAYMERKL